MTGVFSIPAGTTSTTGCTALASVGSTVALRSRPPWDESTAPLSQHFDPWCTVGEATAFHRDQMGNTVAILTKSSDILSGAMWHAVVQLLSY